MSALRPLPRLRGDGKRGRKRSIVAAALVVDIDSGTFLAGFLVSGLPMLCSRRASAGLSSQEKDCFTCDAGFAGFGAPRVMFPSCCPLAPDARHHGRYTPKGQLCALRFRQWHVQASFCGHFAPLAVFLLWSLSAGPPPGRRHVRYGPGGPVRSWLVSLYGPLYLAGTCSTWFLLEEYSTCLFWEMTSGYVVFSASWIDSGYMLLPVYGFWGVLFPYSAQCSVLCGPRYALVTELRRRLPLRAAEADPHGLFSPSCSSFFGGRSLLCGSCRFSGAAVEKTPALPQLQFNHRCSVVQTAENCRCSSSLVVDFPVVVQRLIPMVCCSADHCFHGCSSWSR